MQDAVRDSLLDDATTFGAQIQHPELDGEYEPDPAKFATPLTLLQKRAVEFMLLREQVIAHSQFGGMICDDMGLGKTLACFALVVEQLHARGPGEPTQKTLVVAGSAVAYEWMRQAAEHLRRGTLRVAKYFGTARKLPDPTTFDVLVTTYGVLRQEYWHDMVFLQGAGRPTHWARKRGGEYEPSPFGELFDRSILDESHAIRNPDSLQHHAACAINAETHWCITGTPVWNSLQDLYAQFKFLQAYPLCVREIFRDRVTLRMCYQPAETVEMLQTFLLPIQIRRTIASLNLPPRSETHVRVPMYENERLFYEALYGFSRDTVRRLFDQESWLRQTGWARAHSLLAGRARQCILSVILRMRQTCVHPQMAIEACKSWGGPPAARPKLLEDAARRLVELVQERGNGTSNLCPICLDQPMDTCYIPCGHSFCQTCSAIVLASEPQQQRCPMCRSEIAESRDIDEALERHGRGSDSEADEEALIVEQEWNPRSSKIDYVLREIQRLQRRQDEEAAGGATKVLVFSQWRRVLDCMARVLDDAGITYLRIDGITSAKRRAEHQQTFTTDPTVTVMLCSLNCCSEGINLQAANTVFIMDPWWTAEKENQAGARTYRLGQTRAVSIVHLVAENTIEEGIIKLQEQKRNLSNISTGRASFDSGLWAERVRLLFDLQDDE